MNNNDNIALKNKIKEQMRKEHLPTLSDEMRERIRANKNQETQPDKSPLKDFVSKSKSLADEILDDD